VYVETDIHKTTLYDFVYKPHFKGENGGHGQSANKTGFSGEDLILQLPPGTLVFQGEKFLGDLKTHGERLRVARGGRSGRGNASFKTSSNTAPHISEKGEPGEDLELDLELKLLADVGLVGLPNAGKSTLLSVVSQARPKIADYPFTTLTPNLGVTHVGEKSFVVADIPGLIEGSHEGKGLGDEFLRHVERTRVLVHLVDVFGSDGKTAFQSFRTLKGELESYSADLAMRPQNIAVTKMDRSRQGLGSFSTTDEKNDPLPPLRCHRDRGERTPQCGGSRPQ
jgi:GTP-binding protein